MARREAAVDFSVIRMQTMTGMDSLLLVSMRLVRAMQMQGRMGL
jgi:hypothetical protein